jgi:hypothetical protein
MEVPLEPSPLRIEGVAERCVHLGSVESNHVLLILFGVESGGFSGQDAEDVDSEEYEHGAEEAYVPVSLS